MVVLFLKKGLSGPFFKKDVDNLIAISLSQQ